VGRHSSDQQWPFIRSVAGWIVPWALVAAVAIAAVYVAVDALGGDSDEHVPATAQAQASPSAAEADEPSPSPTPDVKGTRQKKKKERKPSPSPPEPELIAEGVSVQVLNGSGSPGADAVMADRLASLGFDVYAVDGASTAYPRTTVFWSYQDARPAAEALAAKFDWEVGPKPTNLSDSVALHVVVGDDEG
jgi:hypothetical protein